MRRAAILAAMLAVAAPAAQGGFETPVPPDTTVPPLNEQDVIWSAKARAFIGYDSNVQFYNDYLPPPVGADGFLGGLTLEGGVEKILHSGWSVGGAFRADLIGYTGGDNDTYDHYSIQPSIFVKHRSRLADGTDLTLLATYSFRKTQAKDWEGIDSTSHQFLANAVFDVPGPWTFFANAAVALADYSVFAGDPLSNRDGTFTEIAIGASYDMNHPFLRKLTGTIGYQNNNASGTNWSYSGFMAAGGAEFDLPGPFAATLGASYAARNYVGDFTSQGFSSPGRQNQQVTTLTGRLIWYASPTHTADLGFKHEIVGSNSSEFTGTRTSITAGLTVKLH